MLEVILLFFAALSLRFLTVRYANAGFDSYGHLYFAKELKAQKIGPFGEISVNIVGSKSFRAPFLWHWLIGFFPIEKILCFQKWVNAGIDALFAVIIYLFALQIDLSRQTALFMSLLYLLTPMFFSRISVGPRISSLTPRLASEVVTNLFLITTFLPLGMPVWLVLVCGALLSAFVVLSSKFGIQAMLFLVPLTSLIAWDPVPVYALTLGIAFAICVTKGGVLKAIDAQCRHLLWYFRKNLKGEVEITKRNSIAQLFAKPSSGGGFFKHLGVVLLRCISLNSYISVLVKMPVLLIVLVLYGLSISSGHGQLPSPIVAPVIAATIVFFLINLPPLLFLGEAERYLNHVAFFIVAMAAILVNDTGIPWIAWVVLGYGCLFWIVESFFLHKLLPTSEKLSARAGDDVIAHLKSIPRPMVVLAYPYHAVGVWRIMAETVHRVIYCVATSKEFSAEFEKSYAAEYPFVKLEKLDDMASQFGVNYLVARKKHLISRGYEQWVPSSQWQKLGVGEPIYDVYQRVQAL